MQARQMRLCQVKWGGEAVRVRIGRSGSATALRHAPEQQRMAQGDWTNHAVMDGYVQRLEPFNEADENLAEIGLGYTSVQDATAQRIADRLL